MACTSVPWVIGYRRAVHQLLRLLTESSSRSLGELRTSLLRCRHKIIAVTPLQCCRCCDSDMVSRLHNSSHATPETPGSPKRVFCGDPASEKPSASVRLDGVCRYILLCGRFEFVLRLHEKQTPGIHTSRKYPAKEGRVPDT